MELCDPGGLGEEGKPRDVATEPGLPWGHTSHQCVGHKGIHPEKAFVTAAETGKAVTHLPC